MTTRLSDRESRLAGEAAGGQKTISVLDPPAGGLVGEVREATAQEMTAAIDRAVQGSSMWRRAPAHERSRVLFEAARRV